MPAEPVEARWPTPNPIAGYEDWPAAVSFRPGGHAFDAAMQEEAFLAEVL